MTADGLPRCHSQTVHCVPVIKFVPPRMFVEIIDEHVASVVHRIVEFIAGDA
jgi:hypothetical protein